MIISIFQGERLLKKKLSDFNLEIAVDKFLIALAECKSLIILYKLMQIPTNLC